MKKILKIGLVVFAALLVLVQLYRPERYTSEEISADHVSRVLNVPPNVESVLKRSCYDCHSNHTRWPWYSNIAPISWFVIADVVGGRKKINFSEWGKISRSKQEIKLEKICDEVSEGEMPLKQYLLIHKEAELSQADKDALCNWTKGVLADWEK